MQGEIADRPKANSRPRNLSHGGPADFTRQFDWGPSVLCTPSLYLFPALSLQGATVLPGKSLPLAQLPHASPPWSWLLQPAHPLQMLAANNGLTTHLQDRKCSLFQKQVAFSSCLHTVGVWGGVWTLGLQCGSMGKTHPGSSSWDSSFRIQLCPGPGTHYSEMETCATGLRSLCR